MVGEAENVEQVGRAKRQDEASGQREFQTADQVRRFCGNLPVFITCLHEYVCCFTCFQLVYDR